jgi:hypothetical protein
LSGVFWAHLLVEMGLFKSYQTAAKALRRMHRKRLIHRIDAPEGRSGFEIIPNQRGIQVFTASEHKIQGDTIQSHEIPCSRLLAKYYPYVDVIRGPYWVDQKTLPDREMVKGDVTWRWEYFTGKQDLKQLVKRFKKYEGTSGTILAVCKKARYIQVVKDASQNVRDDIYFSTYEEVMRKPFGEVWQDYNGERIAITIPVEDGVSNPL